MILIPNALAATPAPLPTVNISNITGTATKIPNTWIISDIFTKGGFNLITFAFTIIGLIFFANLILAGWDFMMGSGDPKKVAGATTRLINGFIGLILAVAAFLAVRLVTTVLGLGTLV